LTAAVKARIRRHSEAWFPREQNIKADELSKLALQGQVAYEQEWVQKLDEFLAQYWEE